MNAQRRNKICIDMLRGCASRHTLIQQQYDKDIIPKQTEVMGADVDSIYVDSIYVDSIYVDSIYVDSIYVDSIYVDRRRDASHGRGVTGTTALKIGSDAPNTAATRFSDPATDSGPRPTFKSRSTRGEQRLSPMTGRAAFPGGSI